jgi:methylthioribose-1-phosphate isomerase
MAMVPAGGRQRTLTPTADGQAIEVIDQTRLPHELAWVRLDGLEAAARAIEAMTVRGAPLIGATAAYGLWLALRADPGDGALAAAGVRLCAARPTAVNLRWAVERVTAAVAPLPARDREAAARRCADAIAEEDVAICAAIGEHGRPLLEQAWRERGQGGGGGGGAATGGGGDRPLQVLTHCNAGWLCAIAWGTALAPIYKAHAAGLPLHVWVDETRPRNQGASLTAWELAQAGVPHTVIADNAGGHLMQRGLVDLVIVGSDRTTARGDVCNKIGTYLKALAARAHGVPFYVGLPGPSIDFALADGLQIPIEERGGDELRRVRGRRPDGGWEVVALMPETTPVRNPAFDVTPAALVTALITERGVCPATAAGLAALYPERVSAAPAPAPPAAT